MDDSIKKKLTADEMELLRKQFEQEAKAKTKEKRDRAKELADDRKAYDQLVTEMIEKKFPMLKDLSDLIVSAKREIYSDFATLLEMRKELFGNGETQTTSFSAGSVTIELGANDVVKLKDTATPGIEKITKYIKSLGGDEKSQGAIGLLLKLLKVDSKGNYNRTNLFTLEKEALQSEDPEFLDGVNILKESMYIESTSRIVRVTYKNEKGVEVRLPLSMTSAPL